MRLYPSKIPAIVDALERSLVQTGDLDVTSSSDFKADVESILKEYLRTEREITERAKDLLEVRGLPYSDLFRIKRQLADQREFGIGDDALRWMSNQLLELFMQSQFVEEIYADDPSIRRKIKEGLKAHMQQDADLDRVVRSNLKHQNDGTDSFEIEYQKRLELVRRKHGLQ